MIEPAVVVQKVVIGECALPPLRIGLIAQTLIAHL